MRTFRRVAASAVALTLVAGVALPAVAGPGPLPIDTKDSFIPAVADEMTSSTAGTVYVADAGTGIFGHVYLVRTPMTTGSATIDLGDRATSTVDGSAPSISGTNVAVPVVVGLADPEPPPVTSVRYCPAATCPAGGGTFTVPATYTYLGNGGDRAILYTEVGTPTVALAPWNGTAATTFAWPNDRPAPTVASGDANGLVLHGGGTATYVARPSLTLSDPIDANPGVVLTPTFVVWYLVGTGPSFDDTIVRAATRSAPNTPSDVVTLPGSPDFNAFAASDAGAAWLLPQDDGSNLLYTMAYGVSAPTLYPRHLDGTALAPFEGGSASFLVDDDRAGIPGLYRVAPGSTGGTLTGLLPVRQAITTSLSVSNARVAYTDDMTEDQPVFLRNVTGGVPDPVEQTLSPSSSTNVALSGPYVAFGDGGQVRYGRTDGSLGTATVPVPDVAQVAASGRRVLVTGGVNSRLIDAVTGAQTNLGHVYAALFGDYLVTLNYDSGVLARKNLASGVVQIIESAVAGCTTFCVDEEGWQLAPWGHEVAYAYAHGGTTPGLRKRVWNGNTNTTVSTLPMLGTFAAPTYYELKYWSGLLLVYRNDFEIHLYEIPAGTDHTVETYGDAPMGLDGHVVAWRKLTDLRAVVHDVTNYVPGHVADPRYLGVVAPAGFGPGTPTGDTWKPSILVSQDVTGTLDLHSGSAAGPVVRSLSASSVNGEVTASWDGLDETRTDVPQGTYWWTFTRTGGAPVALTNAAGTAPASGTVYLSRAPLGAPALTAPVLASDTSTSATFPISWTAPAGAPAGTKYVVYRSVNGGATTALPGTVTGTTMAFPGVAGSTYRIKVAAVDPAGRVGAFSATKTTVVPYNDYAAGTAVTGPWGSASSASLYGGQHHYATAAGATYAFHATGTAIWLVGIKAASYGQFQVSIDGGAYSGLIDAHSASTRFRQVLYSRGSLSNAVHTIKVRVYGTAGRPTVGIDAVGYRR
jgi:hypothetical protein